MKKMRPNKNLEPHSDSIGTGKALAKRVPRTTPAKVYAHLRGSAVLEAQAEGDVVVRVDGYSLTLGRLSAGAVDRVRKLGTGLPLASFAGGTRNIDKEITLLVRRLARHGLLDYRLKGARIGEDLVVIEPQCPDYWPQAAPLGETDALVLSRFAYMRRRGDEMILESPRAGALFKICSPKIMTTLAMLSTPRQIKDLRRSDGFPGLAFLALLVDSRIAQTDTPNKRKPLPVEGDLNLALWDFHDLLFHARSTQGRHANPIGGIYPYAGIIPPLPALRPAWQGKSIDLRQHSTADPGSIPAIAKLLRDRHSTRSFDDQQPITLAELARFLDSTARVQSTSASELDFDDGGHAVRPYPSAGASYALELYLAVNTCDGLARGFYHYDAGTHALVEIDVSPHELEAQLMGADYAMGVATSPQILITITARFGRVAWKYGSIAYSLILRDVGVLLQTFYLMASDMGLGGCAIGITDIDLFAKMTGLEFHVEGPVGQFAIGRGKTSGASG
jgi:SagB-type dehydrogenase family enzyme